MVAKDGIYHSTIVTQALINTVNSKRKFALTDIQIQFLELCCSDMSYGQISDIMCVSVRTVHGYRDKLCEKLKVKTRVGLVQYAYETGIYHIEGRTAS